jgi:hypothetical protein
LKPEIVLQRIKMSMVLSRLEKNIKQ